MVFIPLTHKHCNKCNNTLSIDNFYKDKTKKDGLSSHCKQCQNERKKLTYKPKPNVKPRSKVDLSDGRHHCKKCDTVRPISEFSKDKSKPHGVSYTCKHCRKSFNDNYHPEYFQKNKEKKAKYNRERKQNNPMVRFKDNIRSLFYNAFLKKGFKKNTRTFAILGCSYEDFVIHMEKQFTEGMCWDNYGKWVIDHIIPLSVALTESDVIKLNHYTNLQPLWATDNRDKWDKLDWVNPNKPS